MAIWFQNIWQWKIEPVPVLLALETDESLE